MSPFATPFATVRSSYNTPGCHSAECCSRFQQKIRDRRKNMRDKTRKLREGTANERFYWEE